MAQPTDKDILFARALVALAREHMMDHLQVTFQHSVRDRTPDVESWRRGPVKLLWSEGRHGSRENIILNYESHLNISEKPE